MRYRHENLTLLFGPLAEREEARNAKWELKVVRDAAIRHRASLASSQVDYVRFTFSGVYWKRGDGDESGAFGQEREKVASNQGAGQRGSRGGQNDRSG